MFHIWSQMDYIAKFDVTPIDLALQLHPHTLRYLLVYPFLYLADIFGLHRDIFYTLFVYGCWVGSFCLSFSILKRNKISNVYIELSYLSLATFYLCTLFFANGRGIVAIFGVMLLFFIQFNEKELNVWKKFFGLTFAFLLCSVSSGITFCFSVIILVLLLLRVKIKNLTNLLFLFTVVFILVCFICLSAEKNIMYFWSISAMLAHGLPGMFASSVSTWGMVVVIFSFAYFVYDKLHKEFGKNVIIFIPYILGGLFGALTFFVVIPALLTAFLFYYIKKSDYQRFSVKTRSLFGIGGVLRET